ncbi:MAG: 4-(cytidine 5'-diphospho)-2-C-methyl-D-erythritol kinase [Ilumatobacteraceae bacterium]
MLIAAPAKLTRTLRIVGVRADGYHLLDAEMIALDLADEVEVMPGGSGLVVDGPFAAGVPVDRHNLAARALDLVGRRAGLRITKRIPHGGGLGGGSADAAAILRWAGVTDPTGAASLGADVPFCVIGGRARVRGVGELVEPLAHEPLTVTLVVPPLAVSTPAVYRAWDELGGPTAAGPNDLEPAALRAEPGLARWRDAIGDLTGEVPVLAGSGSTWFVPGERDGALAALGGEGAVVIVARAIPGSGSRYLRRW